MAFPRLLWNNIVRQASSVTASSTDTGFSVAGAYDYLPWSLWRSGTLVTGITIDIDMGASVDWASCLGLVNANVALLGGTVEVRADTFTPPTTVRIAAYTPTYNDVELKDFTSHAACRYYRIVLAKGGDFSAKPFIGELWLGNPMVWPEYLDPGIDPFMKSTEGAIEMTAGGHYAGATVRGRVHRFNLAVSSVGMQRSFHTSDVTLFVDQHLDLFRPFIWQTDSADSDFSKPLYLVRDEKGGVERLAVGSSWNRLGFKVPVVEAWMEAA